jgi:hypothetical protein
VIPGHATRPDDSWDRIDYQALLGAAAARGRRAADYLRSELPEIWLETYISATRRPVNVLMFSRGCFDYLCDDYAALEATGVVPSALAHEARRVSTIGVSAPQRTPRDDGRLRG